MLCWDIFCSVVDNFGDIGICWRLARQLSDSDQFAVRLWVDNLASFARLCPSVSTTAATQRVGNIEVCRWSPDFPTVEVADVVIEAFACELPTRYISAMAERPTPPVWINLEYLSAEAWVEDCHQVPSPHPRHRLTKYFFFPGFGPRTGGLLKERDLLSARSKFDWRACQAFWDEIGIPPQSDGEFRVSLFCYQNPVLPELLNALAAGQEKVRLLVCPSPAMDQVAAWAGQALSPGQSLQKQSLTITSLPFLPQDAYDRLLWACDVNFVRGEDSFVRAQWAQRPFIWQPYPQSEQTHMVKLDAFLGRYSREFGKPDVVRNCWLAWNGVGELACAWREFAANRKFIEQYSRVWACQLDQATDLVNNLVLFVRAKMSDLRAI